jgi:hypothetical protein
MCRNMRKICFCLVSVTVAVSLTAVGSHFAIELDIPWFFIMPPIMLTYVLCRV